MVKCQVVKPIAGYGYHTNDTGEFPEELAEKMIKIGFLKAVIEPGKTTKEGKPKK
jgi:hypothetical protein